jgi:acyl carrier protein
MNMQRSEIIKRLKKHFAEDVLDGKDVGLDDATPLLEWGIINSLEIMRLLTFIREHFGTEIPYTDLSADNFTDISSIADMILRNTLS